MNLTKNILFINFNRNKKSNILKKNFYEIIKNKNEVLNSLKPNYNYSYSNNFVKKIKNKLNCRIIGMGGSILGTKAIYKFLKHKIKKKVYFVDNLESYKKNTNSKNFFNIIVSKSGNTLETISNVNILLKKGDKNLFVTQNDENYLRALAKKLKSEIIDHNNFIGGRYSVLSEVGMLPASLFGLKEKKFKQFNNLIKNKNFVNSLIRNAANIIFYIKNKKYNSIIVNYDKDSQELFEWYQQLVAESLGKNNTGIYPNISLMPKDNHSLMQLYLDGPKKSFYTFFNFINKNSTKLNDKLLLNSHKYLKNINTNDILLFQKKATEKVFKKKNIPFRSFQILNKNEETLGQLFTFFILETILVAKALKINPYDQPAVELIKKETKNYLVNK